MTVPTTIAVEVPAKLFGGIPDAWHYLAIGTAFNAIRILALGLVVGALTASR